MSGGSFDPTLATSPLWALIGGGKRIADEEAWQPCSSQPCKARAPLTCSACQAAHYCSRFVDSLCKFIHITSVIREHQRAHWPKHKSSCAPFTLRNSATRGRHLVASRAIARGEVILEVFLFYYQSFPCLSTLPLSGASNHSWATPVHISCLSWLPQACLPIWAPVSFLHCPDPYLYLVSHGTYFLAATFPCQDVPNVVGRSAVHSVRKNLSTGQSVRLELLPNTNNF